MKTTDLWWRQQIYGKDDRFLSFVQCLLCILMSEVTALSMCRHTNEGIPSTERVQMLYWACADMLMGGNPVTQTVFAHISLIRETINENVLTAACWSTMRDLSVEMWIPVEGGTCCSRYSRELQALAGVLPQPSLSFPLCSTYQRSSKKNISHYKIDLKASL